MRVKGKLVTLVLSASVIPLALLAILSYQSARANLEQMIGRQLAAGAHAVLGDLSTDLERDFGLLSSWAELAVMQDTLTDDGDGGIQKQIQALAKRFTQFGDIAVLNDQGKVIAATKDGLAGSDLGGEAAYAAARAAKPYRGALASSPYARAPGLTFAVPVRAAYDANTVIGVVVAVADWKMVQQHLQSVSVFSAPQGEDRQMALVGTDGTALYGPAVAGLPPAAGSSEQAIAGRQVLVGTAIDAGRGWALHQIVSAETAYQAVIELKRQAIMLGLILAGLAAAAAALAAQRFVSPIARVTLAMKRLAEGDLEVDIGIPPRRDEFGDMAEAIGVFRDNAIRVGSLTAAADLARKQEEDRLAKDKRAAVIDQLLKEFNQEVSDVLELMESSAAELEATSQSMHTTAEITTSEATLVAIAVDETATNMRGLAGTAGRLASSVEEISKRVKDSAQIATQAQEKVWETNMSVRGLSEAVTKISDIVGMINAIASQTNMLALNATIEAARAGEAGRGFAVVADEVKKLSQQTAKATQEITAQIAAVQRETQAAVTAISEITGIISTMGEIASDINVSVADQDSATTEIASNVDHVAQATSEVSGNVQGVNEAAEETRRAAGSVLDASGKMARRATALRSHVDTFLSNIRAA
jgi:methyl-accepting chemotaxis protein